MQRFILALALASLTACQGEAGFDMIEAENAWVRLPAVAGRPGAGYLHLRNDGRARRLVAARTPAAARVELHESMRHGGMMTMQPLDGLAIAAQESVTLAPGGKHMMLFDVSPTLRAGGEVPLTLVFEQGEPIEVAARVVAAGDPAPDFD